MSMQMEHELYSFSDSITCKAEKEKGRNQWKKSNDRFLCHPSYLDCKCQWRCLMIGLKLAPNLLSHKPQITSFISSKINEAFGITSWTDKHMYVVSSQPNNEMWIWKGNIVENLSSCYFFMGLLDWSINSADIQGNHRAGFRFFAWNFFFIRALQHIYFYSINLEISWWRGTLAKPKSTKFQK